MSNSLYDEYHHTSLSKIKEDVLNVFYEQPLQNSIADIEQKLGHKYAKHLIARAFWGLCSDGKLEVNRTKLILIDEIDSITVLKEVSNTERIYDMAKEAGRKCANELVNRYPDSYD